MAKYGNNHFPLLDLTSNFCERRVIVEIYILETRTNIIVLTQNVLIIYHGMINANLYFPQLFAARVIHLARLLLGVRQANERRRYFVTTSFIG